MVSKARDTLTQELRKAGLSKSAIEAAWPTWWTEEADESPSGRAELRLALCRRLGLSPKALLGERVEFYWDDSARFKHLKVHDAEEQAAIASFGIALGRDLLIATTEPASHITWQNSDAESLRASILKRRRFVDLASIIGACWSFGIPVIHLAVVPLEAKHMHAMVVKHRERFAILLARNIPYPAMAAFTLAHELGHILLGHVEDDVALVDLESSTDDPDGDAQEQAADAFALTLLTGSTDPVIETDRKDFNAPSLADAAMRASAEYQVEPGTIALSLAHRDGSWARSMSALKFIYGDIPPVTGEINRLAHIMLNWDALVDDAAVYIQNVMTGSND